MYVIYIIPRLRRITSIEDIRSKYKNITITINNNAKLIQIDSEDKELLAEYLEEFPAFNKLLELQDNLCKLNKGRLKKLYKEKYNKRIYFMSKKKIINHLLYKEILKDLNNFYM